MTRAVVVAALAVGCSDTPLVPMQLLPDHLQQVDALSAGPLMLEARDGAGGFRITVRDLDFARSEQTFWAADLSCAAQGVAVVDTNTGAMSEYWMDCTHSGFDGKISIAAFFTPIAADETRIEVWADNQLEGAALANAMYVMRIAEASYPLDPNDLRSRFLLEDWISNPMQQMRETGEMTNRAGHAPICDAERTNCLYKNRNKATPAMSLHTPDWGVLVHTMDPENADSGYLMLGGAVTEDGSPRLDFGYESQVSMADVEANGGGIMALTPVLSARTLPAEAPLNDAWWEALEVYRDYVETETDLFPAQRLGDDPAFAAWSETCIYNALYVTDAQGNVKIDDIAAFFDEMMAFYAAPGDPVDICPLAWAALSFAPYEFAPGTQELVDELKIAAARYPNVEVHPMFYVDTGCAQDALEVPDEAWQYVNGQKWLCHDGIAHAIDPSVPEVQDALREILPVAMEMGFEGVYHDAPFGDYLVPDSGGDRRFAQGIRANVEVLAETMADNGGGVVVIEDGRLGLHSQQTRMAPLLYPFFTESSISNFGPALFHGHHLTGTSGSIGDGVWGFLFGDAQADPFLKDSCAQRPRGGTVPFQPGLVGNAEHTPRHAIFGAVIGGVIHDSQTAHWRVNPEDNEVYAYWKDRYVHILRDIAALRVRTPALRRGVMVRPPSTDIQTTTIGARMPVMNAGGVEVQTCQLALRDVPEVELALYEDPETETDLVLVLGNAMGSPRTVNVDLATLAHPRIEPGASLQVWDPDGETAPMPVDGTLAVDIDEYTIRVLHLTTAGAATPAAQ